ncbi:hypothetical protein [Fibrobacter sp.]|uniref:hypothetical protein n=1 Tax=Fibrobacter sp. TaxID=35828 RepID=UPI0038675F7D
MRRNSEFLYLWGMQTKNPARMAKYAMCSLLALSFGLGLSACGDGGTKTAGGGPSGSEAGNAITAEILTADKTPAALARVRLMDSEGLDCDKAYSAQTDKKGSVTIEGVADGDYTLEASLEGEALQIPVKVSGKDVDLGSDELKKMATVSGSVGNPSANGTVKVRGMEHSAKVVDGSFTLDSLPEGALSLVFISDADHQDTTSTYLKAVAGEKSTSSTFAEESRALLLDDFQDSNYQNRFMPARTYDGGWWFFSYSEKTVTPDSTLIFGKNHIFKLENEDGNIVAHVAAEMGESFEDSTGEQYWAWATMGVELGKSDKKLCNDISSVDSVAFRIKGKGIIVFTVVDANLPIEDQKIARFEYRMSDEWERVSVPLADILNSQYSYKCVNQLDWDFKANPAEPIVEIWLDDIELIGGDRLSIWEK